MRHLVQFILAVTLCTAVTPASAQDVYERKPPYMSIFGLRGYKTIEVEPGLYTFRYGGFRNIFVVTDDGVIATDPINPTAAAVMREEIAKITNQPVKYLVYSHWHWDHVLGGQIFKDDGATFVSHEKCVDHFTFNPHADLVMPDETFSSNHEIKLGGTTLELLYFGPNHSDCNVVMRVKGSKVLFVNDLVTPYYTGFGTMPDYDPGGLRDTLAEMGKLGAERLIGGHGVPIAPASQITEQYAFLNTMLTGVKQALDARTPRSEILASIDLSAYEHLEGMEDQLPRFMERILFYHTMGW
ncbi:MAG: MBL fold metallo-hydrolase [Rhodospirillaceae bacterium]|jgi:glyoxylase-like metal-dependent hydrolase (beta-lactamase superfamily II)|nr:MBL fold metallo-hydrolase [Rhodospirillaceae bacterium]